MIGFSKKSRESTFFFRDFMVYKTGSFNCRRPGIIIVVDHWRIGDVDQGVHFGDEFEEGAQEDIGFRGRKQQERISRNNDPDLPPP